MLWFLALSSVGNLVFGYLWITASHALEDAQFANVLAMDSIEYWRGKHAQRESFRKGA